MEKSEIVAKGILYKEKTIEYYATEFNLTKSRIRQLLWIGLKNMQNKNLKGDG